VTAVGIARDGGNVSGGRAAGEDVLTRAGLPAPLVAEAPEPRPIVLAAARALFRAPQAEDACWADLELADGTVRACGRQEATSLGLCADHLTELFGIQA
jgi:hypothetical protein